MDEKTVNTTNTEATREVTNDLLIKFNKPYVFEGQSYTEIDLSSIENISTKDLVAVDKLFYQTGNIAPSSEMSLAYACIVASKAAGKPLEFFNQLPAKEGIKVKTAVVSFLYN
ncbi:phage tail assembly protein [Clostridium magnum]|uniref:Phage tail assembly protein n=1 Tax=Clostridium magnum DSM 2767 TaxID=1121326 RepID=A0A162QMJ5_9CLOT|nr:phage tail assembly protein [Clostridium magnum]KZL88715.1 hypothetical protein CLMAG_60040 [Clostridium magnum DSM 2767]SHJ44072.1 Phage tail assembly chaperone protein, E, or 41 or 14 [Clostridium magnum DSM 2767]